MMEVGRICIKLAGRDAGMKCVIVDVIDKNNVLIDGQTRRRKCNVKHLEPLNQLIQIKKGDSHAVIKTALKKLKIETRETKPKQASPRTKKIKLKKEKKVKEVKKEKKVAKETIEEKAKTVEKPKEEKKETKKKTVKKVTKKATKKTTKKTSK